MKSLILALAVAAVVTPVAQARVDSERSQVSPASALNQKTDPAIRALMLRSEAMNAWYRQHSSTPVIPDAFSRELTKAQSVSSAVVHADDRAGVRGPGIVQTPQVVSSSSGGFDWGDASVGAGTALGIALILGSGLVLVRRNQSGHQVAA
jgi:LPXTG-motif cell wall-anchored protein